MADQIIKMKTLLGTDQFKGLDRSYSSAKNAYGDVGEGGDETLTWYLVDRATTHWGTDSLKHLFMTLGLARENDADQSDLDRAFGFTDWYKGNVALIGQFPQSGVSSYIDGATVRVRVPTGTTSGDYVEFFGSTFQGHRDMGSGKDVCIGNAGPSVYGGAFCYLFPDTQGPNSIDEDGFGEHPYTGAIDGAVHVNKDAVSWTGANTEAKTFYPHLRATQWTRNPDDGRDVPYGIFLLERGLFAIFDMDGRTNFLGPEITGKTSGDAGGIFSADTATFDAVTVSAGTQEPNTNPANAMAIRFTGAAGLENARVFYRTVTEDYKLVYFCHAGQGEFNSTSNHTYDHRKAFFRPDEADDIYVTEIALYDDNQEVMAYAKLSEPVTKNQLETLTFKVELNIGSS
jgi:hypothetical protein